MFRAVEDGETAKVQQLLYFESDIFHLVDLLWQGRLAVSTIVLGGKRGRRREKESGRVRRKVKRGGERCIGKTLR